MKRVFLFSHAVLLSGYVLFGKGFAYISVGPIYIGEIVLAMGLISAIWVKRASIVFRSPVTLILFCFVVWGAIRTIYYIPSYGLVALRDAVIWGYGIFAFLVVVFLINEKALWSVVRLYHRLIPWIIIWFPFALFISLPYMKAGDVAVHLAGVAVFTILGLNRAVILRQAKTTIWLKDWIFWSVWFTGFVMAVTRSRSGLLAILISFLFVFSMRPLSRWGKTALVVLLLLTIFVISDMQINVGNYRKVSVEQLTQNITSVLGYSEDPNLIGTRKWRLLWWGTIIDYTVFGPYFWIGKGFGINLADDDGFQVSADHSLRSPHNVHLTILARMGVPGFVLWVLLQGVFGISLIRAYLRTRRRLQIWALIDLWIFSYWIAFLINGTFDVFFEGPQGGIWFWSLFGFGIAVLQIQQKRVKAQSVLPEQVLSKNIIQYGNISG